tara:strand:- start:26017 stop:26301 length:285 start_codon:yes stop_codon:yes gene_type:complete
MEVLVKLIGWVVTIFIIILGVSFSALNAEPVTVKYLFGERDLPLAVVLLIAFAFGIVLSILILGTKVLSLSAKNKWLTKKLKRAEDERIQPKAD